MGWDVVIRGALTFPSAAARAAWKASSIVDHEGWPLDMPIGKRSKVSAVIGRARKWDGYVALEDAKTRFSISAHVAQEAFRTLGRQLGGAFAAAAAHDARGDICFAGRGIELSHRIAIADGRMRVAKLTKKNQAEIAAVEAAARDDLLAEHPDAAALVAGLPTWEEISGAWARDLAAAGQRLEKACAAARDPLAPLLAAVANTSRREPVQHEREAATAMLVAGDAATAARVLGELEAQLASAKAIGKVAQQLMDALGPRAPKRAEARLLELFRRGKPFTGQICAGRALLRCFSQLGDPGPYVNLPTLAEQIDPLYP